jgi:hypothetical protein
LTRDVGTVFLTDTDRNKSLEKFAGMCEQLLDHHTTLTDIRHHSESDQKPLRLKVTVSLEEA